MELAVVVPTYWGPVQDYRLGKPSPAYDHPTPLSSQGTLPRLLEGLARTEGPDFSVFVVVGATSPELQDEAERRVKGILADFRKELAVALVGRGTVSRLRTWLNERGLEPELISLRGYGNVRNLGLAVGLLSGAEAIVFLDDDEVVGPDYLARAAEAARACPGAGGPYLDQHGSPYLPEPPAQGNIFLDKARHMNLALKGLVGGGGRKATALAFGGNMVISRELARAVPFDPLIPRGEDIDYVISAWLLGFEYFFDPGLVVTHLPPAEPRPSPCEALCRDVVRFLYQREKLARAGEQGMTVGVDLGPYPGRFLAGDLESQATLALAKVCGWSETEGRAFVERVRDWARRDSPRFFRFAGEWEDFVTGVLDRPRADIGDGLGNGCCPDGDG